MYELKLPIHESSVDQSYGRIDIAPRVMGKKDYDEELGYLLAYDPYDKCYWIAWDDIPSRRWVTFDEFIIISNITPTK